MTGSLSVTDVAVDGRKVGVRCVDGMITDIGPDVAPRPGDEVIRAEGRRLVSPLINGHTHAAMTLFRGHGDDLPLMRWLKEIIWPLEARLEPEDVYWGVRLACLEMVASGTTCFWDMYWHPHAAARAVRDAGLRATIGIPLIDSDTSPKELKVQTVATLAQLLEVDGLITPALAPHAIYTVSEESLRWVAELAFERDLPVHMHLAETEPEVQDCLNAHGERPVAYVDRLGLLGGRTLLAHGVWVEPAELSVIAERQATIVTNPVANLKLGVGNVFDYLAARRAGVAVGLGTDGPASNNSLDMFDDLKIFALVQKHRAADPAAVSADEAWALGTGARAPLLGQARQIAVGQPADFLLLRDQTTELSFGEQYSAMVYGATGAIVDTVVVNGRVLMHQRAISGADEILDRARACARRLGLAPPQ
jgi:5-methylthioadenosine/S-adenosylhomocysteine deaminase